VPGSLINIDLRSEPRSSSAILCGRGDGRDNLYEVFTEYWRRTRPALTEEELGGGFEQYAWQAMRFSSRWFGNIGRISGRTSVAVMRCWLFFGWYGSEADNFFLTTKF